MKKLIYIISAVLLLAFASGVNAGSCFDDKTDIADCKVRAEQGDAWGQLMLGASYYLGKGVLQDYQKAVEWYSKAAEQGHTEAQWVLGEMYESGKGVPQDYVMAHMFWNIAGANGNKSGASLRDFISKQMTPSQLAEAQDLAREWMQKHP